jgi:hypothetical protein
MIEDKILAAVSEKRCSTSSELDWRIVEMARTDGRRSLNPDGFRARLARKLFGISIPRPLANEALEALRRFSVRAWHWNFVRASDLGMLIDAGYSRADALQILAHIASRRGCMPCAQDGLLKIGTGLDGSFPLSRPSSSVAALPAPQAPSLAPRRGQGLQTEVWQPCPCR